MPRDHDDLPFDEALAATYVGSYILVGLTYVDHTGVEVRRQQLHGTIQAASREGILIALRGAHEGRSWNMPPALDAIRPADPGEYRLESTGETIADPDLVATWEISQSRPDADSKPDP